MFLKHFPYKKNMDRYKKSMEKNYSDSVKRKKELNECVNHLKTMINCLYESKPKKFEISYNLLEKRISPHTIRGDLDFLKIDRIRQSLSIAKGEDISSLGVSKLVALTDARKNFSELLKESYQD